jgi:hypothetical protein
MIMGFRSDCFLSHCKFWMKLTVFKCMVNHSRILVRSPCLSDSIFVVPAKTPYQLCVTFLNLRFFHTWDRIIQSLQHSEHPFWVCIYSLRVWVIPIILQLHTMEGPWLMNYCNRDSMHVIGLNTHGRSHLNTAHF